MSFPWLAEINWESGSLTEGGFSETDTENRIAVRHFEFISRNYNYPNLVPHTGAYCAHVQLANDGSPADAFLSHTTPFVTALDGTISVRFYVYVTGDLVMAASDRFDIFRLESVGPVVEAAIGIVNTAGVINIGVSETASSTQTLANLELNKWHCVELVAVIDDGGSNDGTAAFYLDGNQVGATITSLNQAAITQASLGVLGQDAGTTAGHIFFDNFVADDARVYPMRDPNQHIVTITKSGHVALGSGSIQEYSLVRFGNNQSTSLD